MKSRMLTSAIALLAALGPVAPAFAQDSAPAPAASRPNVLIWMMDDVGFAQIDCFGGLIETPNIDRMSAAGLRYANYHTAAICSASRAAMLTGRNPHSVHMGGHALANRPLPGYDAKIPAEDGTIAANLHAAGYTTFALGKWDHLPTEEMTAAGPFTHWPTGQGFDNWYGFLSAETDNWHPVLIHNTTPIATPDTPGYHLSRDLADQAISMIDSRSARTDPAPFFMYFATGAAHAPHHAPKNWIDHYKGRFDMGWDKVRETILTREIQQGLIPAGTVLAPRPEGMPAWDSLTSDQKKLYARQMEVFAAALSYADEQFGRVIDHLKSTGQLDNTIVVVTSDNGASAEGAYNGTYSELAVTSDKLISVAENMRYYDKWGGPETHPHYSFGWAVAGNTPFRYYKQVTHEGGVHVPFVISWPKGIAAHGELRQQFVDVEDIAPTVLDLTGVKLASTINNVKQAPMQGTSFAYTIANPAAPDRKDAQYFEMYGNKALWSKGWTIATTHRIKTWDGTLATPPNEPWELYDVTRDPGQTTNLASKYPDKVASLAAAFDSQAKQFNVYPIGNMSDARAYRRQFGEEMFAARGGKWVFPGPVWHIAEGAAPPTTQRPFHLSAMINLPTNHETGPIYAQGSALGGLGFYLKSGVPAFVIRGVDGSSTVVSAPAALPASTTSLDLDVDRKPGAPFVPQDITITIGADGHNLVRKTVKAVIAPTFGISEAFDLGNDFGGAVTSAYKAGVPFSGTIGQVVFDFNRKQKLSEND